MTNGEARFRAVVSAVLGVSPEDVSDRLSPENTDTWDSLNHINLIGALEQEFGVTLPTYTLAEVQSVASLRAVLAERGVAV